MRLWPEVSGGHKLEEAAERAGGAGATAVRCRACSAGAGDPSGADEGRGRAGPIYRPTDSRSARL